MSTTTEIKITPIASNQTDRNLSASSIVVKLMTIAVTKLPIRLVRDPIIAQRTKFVAKAKLI
jgi:hypothetical protein